MNNKIKVLNLYAGIGGNRKLWKDDEVDVTAVEINKNIAKIYQNFFPNDKVVIDDAHKYLKEHYDEFDFIWSSPPCPTHSRARYWGSFRENATKVYPDMSLYQEIIFLKNYAKCKWVIENVKPYYKPLIRAKQVGRHLFWSNFHIQCKDSKTMFFPKDNLSKLQEIYDIDLSDLDIDFDKRKVLRNCVNPELGLHIFNCAFKEKQEGIEKWTK